MKKHHTEITISLAEERGKEPYSTSNELSRVSLFWVIFLIIMSTILGLSSSFANDTHPDNVIKYVATGKITPKLKGHAPHDERYEDPDCNFEVVSHTYNPQTGKGVITLDRPMDIIAKGAFADCDKLTHITIPESVTIIKDGAFACCDNLTYLYIPDHVKEIRRGAFMRCDNLKDVRLPSGLKSISKQLFYHCESLERIIIPEGVTDIGYMAFFNCRSLRQITIPESVQSIDKDVFIWCYSLEALYGKYATDDNCALIVDGRFIAFANARNIKEYTIPDEVTRIEAHVIANKHLTTITIGPNVEYIGVEAMYDTNLNTVYCNAVTPPTIEEGTYHPHQLEPDGGEFFQTKRELMICLCIDYTRSWSAFNWNPHNDTHTDLKIYVPAESTDAYRTVTEWYKLSGWSGWSGYSEIIEAM